MSDGGLEMKGGGGKSNLRTVTTVEHQKCGREGQHDSTPETKPPSTRKTPGNENQNERWARASERRKTGGEEQEDLSGISLRYR